MRIAVIGAGNVGAALSAAAVKAGHTVTISAAHPEKAADVAAATGATAAAGNASAAEGADLVVLAVPAAVAPAVAAEVAAAGAPLVDATNPLNATYDGLDIEGVSHAHAVQAAAGTTPVVKALNTLFAGRYATPQENGKPLDAFLAGDDATAKRVVATFTESLGLRPIDTGDLRRARALEELAFLNISLNAGNGWVWQTGWQLAGPTTPAA